MKICAKIKKYLQAKFLGLSFPLVCEVRGVTDRETQGALVQSADGDSLQIVHTPTDTLPYRVFVYNIEINRLIGHIDKRLAKKLVKFYGKSFCRDGTIVSRTGGLPYKYYGCTLEISDEMQAMKDVEDFRHLRGE
ncbi:MAG: hypothetical protein IJ514_01230 [Clostridia bacterium]|nr:hypothetical protein [Clostridia bacterium]